jgi:hypothetical protein
MKKMRTPSEYWPIEGEKGYKNLSLKN